MDEATPKVEVPTQKAPASVEEVVAVAQEVLFRGVVQGQLDPSNANHQVIVCGAMLVLACASAGLSPDEAFALIHANNKRGEKPDAKAESKPGYGGYL